MLPIATEREGVQEYLSASSVVPVEPNLLDGWCSAAEDEVVAAVGFIAIQTPFRHPRPAVERTLLNAHQLSMLRSLRVRKKGDGESLAGDYEFIRSGVDDDRGAGGHA